MSVQSALVRVNLIWGVKVSRRLRIFRRTAWIEKIVVSAWG